MEPVRVVHYINQFFGGIGGEEKADAGLLIHEKPIGPGLGLQKELGDAGRIVATIVCGDNYVNLHMESARREILEAVRGFRPDVLVAGPAFNAGRYGVACGEICKSVSETLRVPAVTAMYLENPGVTVYKSAPNVWILPTSDLAASMAKVLPKLAAFALKVAKGSVVGPAEQEGYIATGRRKLEAAQTPGADRAIAMLLAKLRGETVASEIPVERLERVRPAPALAKPQAARLAVITTSGMVPKGNPDEFKMFNATQWSKYYVPEAGILRPEDWEFVHGGFNTAFAQADPNLVLPLDALRSFAGDRYGELHREFYSLTGVGTSLTIAQKAGQEIAASMREAHVDAALLVAT